MPKSGPCDHCGEPGVFRKRFGLVLCDAHNAEAGKEIEGMKRAAARHAKEWLRDFAQYRPKGDDFVLARGLLALAPAGPHAFKVRLADGGFEPLATILEEHGLEGKRVEVRIQPLHEAASLTAAKAGP